MKTESYQQAKEALQEHFEPSSKREFYKSDLQHRVKQVTECWGDFADELGVLVDNANPQLQEEAKEYIALSRYIDQIEDSRIAFGVRQRHPKNYVKSCSCYRGT